MSSIIIEVKLTMDELDLTTAESKTGYEEIKDVYAAKVWVEGQQSVYCAGKKKV